MLASFLGYPLTPFVESANKGCPCFHEGEGNAPRRFSAIQFVRHVPEKLFGTCKGSEDHQATQRELGHLPCTRCHAPRIRPLWHLPLQPRPATAPVFWFDSVGGGGGDFPAVSCGLRAMVKTPFYLNLPRRGVPFVSLKRRQKQTGCLQNCSVQRKANRLFALFLLAIFRQGPTMACPGPFCG